MKGFLRLLGVLLLLSVASVFPSCVPGKPVPEEPSITLVVHGGAGTITREKMTEELELQYRQSLTAALRAGFEILQGGGSSLDAVEKVIVFMEDSPLFNAGKGSVFTHQGKNEMDALIMNGADLRAGGVTAVTTIKNPILAARAVMENSRHILLAGRGAELFAAEQGLEMVEPEYFFTRRRWEALLEAKEKAKEKTSSPNPLPLRPEEGGGTVGAVALDSAGNLAAATSTGGLTNKLHGRVGDTPIIGAGNYANNRTCAVSGTGQGEFFMRNLVAYDVGAIMDYAGMALSEAADRVIHEKLTGLGGKGGLIALDRNGNIAMPFNTDGMYRGYIRADGDPHVFIYGEEETIIP